MNRLTSVLVAAIVALIVGMWYTTTRIKNISADLEKITQLSDKQKSDLENIQRQRTQSAELDIKVTQELANAKSEIEQLRIDLGNGTKRLRINASCPKLPKTPTAPGKLDAASPRLNNAAERDYLTLIERIRTATTMINGLQGYIRTHCENYQ